MTELIEDLAEFVQASPSSYHAAVEVATRLVEHGFTQLGEHQSWPTSPGGYVVIRDGGVIAWVIPHTSGPQTPLRLLGAHTDSPGFKLKPQSTGVAEGWIQAGVEIYGAPLLNSWLDRELRIAGRVVTRDGAEHLVSTSPVARIPQLAIHLDRAVNDGLTLHKQHHTSPVLGIETAGLNGEHADVLGAIAESAGLQAADIDGYDLILADTQPPQRFGLHQEFFASGRLDNLSSVYTGLRALIAASASDAAAAAIPMLAAFDHEEIGSQSRSGAAGSFLEEVTLRIYAGLGTTYDERCRALADSWHVSADAGHAVHPNYPERHDPANRPRLNAGPLLKINANQRYTTDATSAGMWARVCRAAQVQYQEFVSRNDIPCGSTIGPLTATRLGIRSVDVGVPLLSMHSVREMCGVEDLTAFSTALEVFFSNTFSS